MVKVSLDYMSDTPRIRIIDIPEMTEKEKELFTKEVIPGMQKDLDVVFMEYKRNSTELASSITQIMNHAVSLEKARYCFNYYENENHVGYYWYDKPQT
jgi:hypothetical protein